jgi:hypothetical protein
VDAAVRHQHFVIVLDGDAVLRPHLFRHQLAKARQSGGLEVVGPVLGNRTRHRGLHRVGRVEAHVPLVEAKRVRHGKHHVADADNA